MSEEELRAALHPRNVGRRSLTFDNGATETVYAIEVDHPAGRWEQVWVLRDSALADRIVAALAAPSTPEPSDPTHDTFKAGWEAGRANLLAESPSTEPALDVERVCPTCHQTIVREAHGGPHPSPGDHDPAAHVAATYGSDR